MKAGFGRPALEALAGAIQEIRRDHPFLPITVLAPNQDTAIHARRRARGEGLAGVRFTTLDPLARTLAGGRIPLGKLPASDFHLAEAARAVLGGSSEQEVQAWLKTFQEVRRGDEKGLPPHVADRFLRWRGLLEPHFYDREDVLEAAAEAVREDSPAAQAVGRVISYLPGKSSGREALLREVLASRPGSVTVEGEAAEDSRPASSLICLAVEPQDEAREAVIQILAWAGEGIRFDQMAFLAPAGSGLIPEAEAGLRRAGVPFHGPEAMTLGHTPPGRLLAGLAGLQGSLLTRRQVFEWLSSSPILWEGKRVDASLWERVARKAEVTRGWSQWVTRLERSKDPEAQTLLRFLAWLEPLICGEDVSWKEAVRALSEAWSFLIDRDALNEAEAEWAAQILAGLDESGSADLLGRTPGPEGRVLLASSVLGRTVTRRSRLGSGVFVGSPAAAMGMDFEGLILAGMTESAFPAPPSDDPILPDGARGEGIPARGMTVSDQRRIFQACRSLAPRVVYSMSRADRRSDRPSLPSPWLLEEAARLEGKDKMFGEELLSLGPATRPWLKAPPSFVASLISQRPPNQADHLARSVLAGSSHPLAEAPSFVRGRTLAEARAGSDFTLFDGKASPYLQLGALSASALETMALCPLRFFYQSRLRLDRGDEPEEGAAMSRLSRGDLVHAALKTFVEKRKERPAGEWPQVMKEVAEEALTQFEAQGATGPDLVWRHQKQVLRDVLLAFVESEEGMGLALEGVQAEWSFGPLDLDLGEGQTLTVLGKVDRWSLTGSGAAAVVDYKVKLTGDPPSYKDPLRAGEEVQLPLYAMVAEQKLGLPPAPEATYAFLKVKDRKWKGVQVRLDEETRGRFRENLRTLKSMIEGGLHPAHPGEACRFCPFERCCTAAKEDEAERKRSSPLLDSWRKLRAKLPEPEKKAKAGQPDGVEAAAPLPPLLAGDDQEAREEIKTSFGPPILVEAGAGTGKTTSLVARLVNRASSLENRLDLSRTAAITFTKKAAGELKDRIRKEIEKRLTSGAAGAERQALEMARTELEGAAMETIHSFCLRLLQKNPLAAGLPPGFTLVDDSSAKTQFDEWWLRLTDRLLAREDLKEAWIGVLDASISFDALKSLAAKLNERWNVAPLLADHEERLEKEREELAGELLAMAQEMADRRSLCSDPSDKLCQELDRMAKALEQFREMPGEAWRIWLDIKLPAVNVGKQGCWQGLQEVKDWVKQVREAWSERADLIRGLDKLAVVLPLLQAIAEEVKDQAKLRTARGLIGFNDLLILTVQTLRERAEFRQAAHDEYQAIFVDEFQDTDPIQAEILFLIATPPPHPLREGIPSGKLFFVGDPKQSIYRFRGADLDVYSEVRDWVQGGGKGKKLSLTTNFRSSREIIAFVNQVFSGLDLGLDALDPLGSPPHLPPSQDPEVVHLLGGLLEGPPRSAEEIRKEQGRDVVRAILEAVGLRGGGPWHARVGRSGEFRPVKLSDIAILIRTRTALPALLRALEGAGIPVRIESRQLILASSELRDLVNVLRALADPLDSASLVGALRSPLFGCSDWDLSLWGASWDYTAPDLPSEDPVGEALFVMRSLRAETAGLRAGEALDSVMERLLVMERAAFQPRPRDKWRRLRLLQSLARQHDQTVGGGLVSFLTRLQAMEDSKEDMAVSVVEEQDDEAVRILTYHAAKGLEYPVVIMAGLGSPRTPFETTRVKWKEDRPEFVLGGKSGCCTSQARKLEQDDALKEDQEVNRLLYVGATRARDHLVLCLHHQDGASLASRLWKQIPLDQRKAKDLGEGTEALPPSEEPIPAPAAWDDWTQEQEGLLGLGRPELPLTPSGLVQEVRAAEGWSARRKPHFRGGPDLGRAVHAVLQNLNLSSPMEGLNRLCEAEALAEDQEPEEVRRLVLRALDQPSVAEAGALPTLREAFVAAEVEGKVLEGYVDLLARRPDGSHLIVDYKTDSVRSREDVEEKMKAYRVQAACYALMVEKALGGGPVEARFVFLRPGIEASLSGEEMAMAQEEVRQILAQSGQASFRAAQF